MGKPLVVWLLGCGALGSASLLGCASAEGVASAAALRGERLSVEEYEALFPRTATVLRPAQEHEADGVSTVIDASDGRGEFPLSPRPRTFASRAQLIDHLAHQVGVDEILRDEEGTPVAARGSYVLRGHTSWTDVATDVRYAITDPILAYLGGVAGTVRIAGELFCLDPDGACDGPRASYLVPEGWLTRPTHITIQGNPPVTATFHSFFNKTPFPFPWARHGNNVSINVAPLPSTSMFTFGSIFFPTNPPPGLSSAPIPMEVRTGQQSVESAVWSIFTTDSPEWNARSICSMGHVDDPDVMGTAFTGNGPFNVADCGP